MRELDGAPHGIGTLERSVNETSEATFVSNAEGPVQPASNIGPASWSFALRKIGSLTVKKRTPV